MWRRASLLVLAMGLACAPPQDGMAGGEGGAGSVTAADESQLMRADRDFAAAVAAGGAEAWAAWFDSQGAMIQPGAGEISGTASIRSAMAGLDQPGVSLEWEPYRAQIAASGDLGYTVGRYTSRGPGEGDAEVVSHGLYVTIWHLQSDGTWKVAMDLGNPVGEGPWPEG